MKSHEKLIVIGAPATITIGGCSTGEQIASVLMGLFSACCLASFAQLFSGQGSISPKRPGETSNDRGLREEIELAARARSKQVFNTTGKDPMEGE